MADGVRQGREAVPEGEGRCSNGRQRGGGDAQGSGQQRSRASGEAVPGGGCKGARKAVLYEIKQEMACNKDL